MTEETSHNDYKNVTEYEVKTLVINREPVKSHMDVDTFDREKGTNAADRKSFQNNGSAEAQLQLNENSIGRVETKSVNSRTCNENDNNSTESQEEELRNLSSTVSVSDEDLGRIVSPPTPPNSYNIYKDSLAKKNLIYSDNQTTVVMELEDIKQSLKHELEHQKMLQSALQSSEEDRNDLNAKLATLRVKLGVANANFNVSKAESDQLRKQNQEAQIQKARLEERISTCTTELEKLKDPTNPDSNINMKKVAANDRKELKRLRNELEGIKSERSETQKQLEIKNEKIRQLDILIATVKEQLDTCQSDLDVANISAEAEMKEREEIELKLNDLISEKMKFDDRMLKVQSKLDSTASGTTGIQKQVELFKEKEQKLLQSISNTEKKLRDAVTEIEQLKNRNMPTRTASSIKYHQYRMSRNSMVSDTTPRFTLGSKSSISSSGSVGSKTSVASFGTAKSTATSSVSASKTASLKGPSTQSIAQKVRMMNGKTK